MKYEQLELSDLYGPLRPLPAKKVLGEEIRTFGPNRINAPVEIYRLHSDGEHYFGGVGIPGTPVPVHIPDMRDEAFEKFVKQSVSVGLRGDEQYQFLLDRMNGAFILLPLEKFSGCGKNARRCFALVTKPDGEVMGEVCGDMESYVTAGLDRLIHNMRCRKKRAIRKAWLNPWNYYSTFTMRPDYNGTSEQWSKRLTRKLQNLCCKTRRGWKVMSRFELGEIGGRIHLHALLYVADEKLDFLQLHLVEGKYGRGQWSKKRHRYEKRLESAEFAKFGNNEWEPLHDNCGSAGSVANYITKYMFKDERFKLSCSRYVPDAVYLTLAKSDELDSYNKGSAEVFLMKEHSARLKELRESIRLRKYCGNRQAAYNAYFNETWDIFGKVPPESSPPPETS